MDTDPLFLLGDLDAATGRLLATVCGLPPAAVAEPSPLPGWTRGHVLAHLARNADGLGNLLTWARTGVETPIYPSRERRNADIEAGAGRPLDEQLADLEAAAARFSTAAHALPAPAWAVTVRNNAGNTMPAARAVWYRLREVEVHHVDLDAGYRPADWPAAFTHRLLHELRAQHREPALRVHATDLDHALTLGDGGPVVTGTAAALAGWLTGRAAGDDLVVDPPGPLPTLPAWL